MICILSVGVAQIALGGEPVDPNLGDTPLGKAGGIRYASESTTFDALNGYASVEVGCGGPRWHLIGGGSAAGGAPDQAWHSFGRPLDYIDADDAGDDGWYTGGYGPDPAAFTGFSICIRNTALRYRFRQVADSPSGLRAGSVGCGGAEWHVTSGSPFIATSGSWTGSSFPRDGGDADHRPDDGWQGTALDTVGGIGGFYLFNVCTRDHDLRYVRRSPVMVSVGGTSNRRVACRQDEHVVGGGARVTGPANRERLVSSYPYDGGDADDVPDDGWQVRAHNLSGNDKQVTAFAICLS
jgi:hypothetical protein